MQDHSSIDCRLILLCPCNNKRLDNYQLMARANTALMVYVHLRRRSASFAWYNQRGEELKREAGRKARDKSAFVKEVAL